jgi:hypothetical protein
MRSLAVVLVLAGCSAPSSDLGTQPDAPTTPTPPDATVPVPPVGDVQMNDLSVLLPLATDADDFAAYLAASSPGGHGALLPEAVYEANDEAFEPSYDQLRVVALRFDPCFAQVVPITDPASCHDQLRLVFQPLVFGAGTTTAPDAAVHVAYAISRAQLVTAVNAIATAREVTTAADLGPLAVNPIVASQGLRGPMAQALAAIITAYADGTRIERITSLLVPPSVIIGGGSPSLFWSLHGFTVVGDTETPLSIPTLGGVTDAGVNASTGPLESLFAPPSSSPDALVVLASAQNAMAATPAARQSAFDAALRIENPGVETPNTIDCASCHMAEPARKLVGEQLFGLSSTANANAFTAAPSIPSADLVTTTALVDADGGLNIHAFSYRGSSPMINQRVVNETAANLGYLKSL